MGWKIYDEAIELLERRFHLFPQVFCWQGRRYEVEAVERCWTVSRRGWRRRVARHFFLVRCAAGHFELFQDVDLNTWHVRRAKLRTPPAPAAQQLAPAWQ